MQLLPLAGAARELRQLVAGRTAVFIQPLDLFSLLESSCIHLVLQTAGYVKCILTPFVETAYVTHLRLSFDVLVKDVRNRLS